MCEFPSPLHTVSCHVAGTAGKELKLPEDAVKAFDEVKEALANATLLSHLQEGAALSL
ncbi:hypothetical protein T02_3215, partial [Trichinella nativa]